MARSSDKNSHQFERKNDKSFVMGITIERTVKFAKWLGRKNTTLVCVTRGMIRAYLNFKDQLNNKSYRLSL